MIELKTLNDIEFYDCWLKKEELKEEAIEWVKEYENQSLNWKGVFFNFFNITEEDLKEKGE